MNADRQRLDTERRKSAEYLLKHFDREHRYLVIYARDFAEYLKSADWLQSAEARSHCKPYEFLADYQGLKSKMAEFRWSKEFLLANGIDFVAIKKLYHSVSSATA